MSEKKVEMKINRYITHISKRDLILDNGSCFQVLTKEVGISLFGIRSLQMSKKLFNQLKKIGFIYLDVSMTKKANENYSKPWLFYFRFDIDKMIASGGYKVVNE